MVPLLIVLAVLVVAAYVALPLVIKASQKMAMRPEFYTLTPEQLPPSLSEYVYGTAAALREHGFEPAAYLTMPNQVPNVRAYLILLMNREAGDKAMVTAMIGEQDGVPTSVTRYLEFSTRFSGGELFDTYNARTLSSFPPGPKTLKTQVPSVEDPQALYRLHRWQMERSGVAGEKSMPEPGQEVAYLTRAMQEDYEQQVRNGILARDDAAGVYRPTLGGAYRMTWGLMFPFNLLRLRALRRREQDLLAQFRRETAQETLAERKRASDAGL
ncbi:MAG TPA: hypothetical protein VM490_20590 [Armatimonadaceae bacterium]|nr:hypothetical protein [Armatimonadaceae bacterium]